MSRYGATPIPIPPLVADQFDLASPALPLGVNEALVISNRVLNTSDPGGFDSATNPDNWQITPVNPQIPKADGTFQVPPGEVVPLVANPIIASVTVDPDFDNQYHIFTVTPMENQVRYTFEISSTVRGTSCETVGDDTVDYRAVTRGLPPQPRFIQEDRLRDFAMTYFPKDPLQPTSTWRFDTNSDIGIQNNLESLQKRIYRRITTKPGGFRHLGTGYGVNLRLKTLFRSGRAQEIANEVARQCRLEPDVLDAGVAVKMRLTGGLHILEISVRVLREDQTSGKFVFPLTLE